MATMDLLSAEYCGGYKIKLVFEDKKSGIVDFSSYAERKGVFEKFKDINFFKNFVIDPEVKTLAWGKEIDIAPETLYSSATQSQLPAWMQK
jgi:hypothetical protein